MLLRCTLLVILIFNFLNEVKTSENVIPEVQKGNKSYHVVRNYKLTFLQAMVYCKQINMTLVTVESPEENEYLKKLFRDRRIKNEVWSSATRLLDGESWIWLSNGNKLEFTKWDTKEPRLNDNHCVTLQHDDQDGMFWRVYNCKSEQEFVCEKDHTKNNEDITKEIWPNILKSAAKIPSRLLVNGTKTYYFSKNVEGSFLKSLQFCELLNMKPISLNSYEENQAIHKHINEKKETDRYWTAGTRILDDLTWYWLPDGHKIEYNNWDDPEPNGKSEHCIGLLLRSGKDAMVYFDVGCKVEMNVICQRDLPAKKRISRSVNKKDDIVEACKQPVINVYINNNVPATSVTSFVPPRVDDESAGEEKSYRVINKLNFVK